MRPLQDIEREYKAIFGIKQLRYELESMEKAFTRDAKDKAAEWKNCEEAVKRSLQHDIDKHHAGQEADYSSCYEEKLPPKSMDFMTMDELITELSGRERSWDVKGFCEDLQKRGKSYDHIMNYLKENVEKWRKQDEANARNIWDIEEDEAKPKKKTPQPKKPEPMETPKPKTLRERIMRTQEYDGKRKAEYMLTINSFDPNEMEARELETFRRGIKEPEGSLGYLRHIQAHINKVIKRREQQQLVEERHQKLLEKKKEQENKWEKIYLRNGYDKKEDKIDGKIRLMSFDMREKLNDAIREMMDTCKENGSDQDEINTKRYELKQEYYEQWEAIEASQKRKEVHERVILNNELRKEKYVETLYSKRIETVKKQAAAMRNIDLTSYILILTGCKANVPSTEPALAKRCTRLKATMTTMDKEE